VSKCSLFGRGVGYQVFPDCVPVVENKKRRRKKKKGEKIEKERK
jgi:hypothetical protein